MARIKLMMAMNIFDSCLWWPCLIQTESIFSDILYAFKFARIQLNIVANTAGKTSFPVRAKALLEMFMNAASGFPARLFEIELSAFTYPVIMKKMATPLRPPTQSLK